MRMISTLAGFFRKSLSGISFDNPFFSDTLPVLESDYPIHGDWYKRFEGKAAGIIPSALHPNHLTIFRLIVSVLLIGFSATLPAFILFLIVALAGLSDFFDGAVARSRNQKTRFGVFFDPIADKLLMLAILCALVLQNAINPSLVVLVGLAEIHVIVIPILSFAYQLAKNGAYRPSIKTEQRVRPSPLGKAKMHFYVYGFLLMAVGHVADSSVILTIGTQVLIAGIVIAFFALIQYVLLWIRNPY